MSVVRCRGASRVGRDKIVSALKHLARKDSWGHVPCREMLDVCEDVVVGTGQSEPSLGGGGVCTIAGPVWAEMVKNGLVCRDGDRARWRISNAGRIFLKRALSRSDAGDGARENESGNGGIASRPVSRAGSGRERNSTGCSACESPLDWLRRRKDRSGKPLITEAQFVAGERLREDFWKGQMSERVTMDWSLAGGTGSRRGGRVDGELTMCEAALAGRERVRRALAAVGPELAGVLVDVCCLMLGLEHTERRAGWPQRSGKVVLGMALDSLVRHYNGGGESIQRGSRVLHWGGEGYRPTGD